MVRYSDHQHGRGADFYRHACQYELEGTVAKRARQALSARPRRRLAQDQMPQQRRVRRRRLYRPERQPARVSARCCSVITIRTGSCVMPAAVGTGFNEEMLADLRSRGSMRSSGASRRSPCRKACRKKACIGPSRASWPRCGTRHGRRTRSCATPRSRACARTRARRRSCTTLNELGNGRSRPTRVARPRTLANAMRERESQQTAEPLSIARAARAQSRVGDGCSENRSRAGAGRQHRLSTGVRLTHPDRVLYPDQGITKLALARVLRRDPRLGPAASANRPLSLVRCPEGQGKECFYQKHATPAVPKVVGRVEIPEGTGTGTGTYTLHQGSRRARRDGADGGARDPSLGLDRQEARNAGPHHLRFRSRCRPALGAGDRGGDRDARGACSASVSRAFRRRPAARGCTSSCRSTPKLEWEAIKEFAKWVAERFVTAYPDRFTSNMAKRARTGRIFIDYLRNGRGATAIGAYSPRARPGAPVATPLFWEEVEKGVKPDSFTVATVPGAPRQAQIRPVGRNARRSGNRSAPGCGARSASSPRVR